MTVCVAMLIWLASDGYGGNAKNNKIYKIKEGQKYDLNEMKSSVKAWPKKIDACQIIIDKNEAKLKSLYDKNSSLLKYDRFPNIQKYLVELRATYYDHKREYVLSRERFDVAVVEWISTRKSIKSATFSSARKLSADYLTVSRIEGELNTAMNSGKAKIRARWFSKIAEALAIRRAMVEQQKIVKDIRADILRFEKMLDKVSKCVAEARQLEREIFAMRKRQGLVVEKYCDALEFYQRISAEKHAK